MNLHYKLVDAGKVYPGKVYPGNHKVKVRPATRCHSKKTIKNVTRDSRTAEYRDDYIKEI